MSNPLDSLKDSYRIERVLGSGGMATVYLAYDVRHDRNVALKVLKPELSAVVGGERFLAEIRTTANLQHPHILPLHDSGSVDGMVFYVMPYVDGESLRDRLTRDKQLPVDDALRIATEVADALQYAHEHDVIHRDIKPENILLQGGHALVADFGIALAASHTAGGRITETGMSLGTPTYMSPEQAMGERSLDARTDVYALACVLYEMLVGEPPFTGATAQQIVARVMTEEPRSLTAQRRTVPPAVDAAVQSALSKLPADRPGSAAAFAAQLAGDASTGRRTYAAPARRATDRTSHAMLIGAATVILAAGVLGAYWLRGAPEAPVTRYFVNFPAGETPVLQSHSFALLPDGSAFFFVARSAGGDQLWIKKREELRATPVNGTLGVSGPFVSPDGKWIGFFADGKLKKVLVSGGEPTVIADEACSGNVCDPSFDGHATWLADGRIAFSSRATLMIVPEGGGPLDSIVTSRAVGGLTPTNASALPGARGLLLDACTYSCNKIVLWVLDLKSRKLTQLGENARYPVYVPSGHILSVDASGALKALPFDLGSLSAKGPAVTVLQHVASSFIVASDGTLVYLDGDPTTRSSLVLVGRNGGEQPVDTAWRENFSTLALSPDGKRIAASIVNGGEEHLWLKTIGGLEPTRFTFDGGAQYTAPTFTADGATVMMSRFAGGGSTWMSRRTDGSAPEAQLGHRSDWVIESYASRDGKWIVTRDYNKVGSRSIFARRTDGDTTEHTIVSGSAAYFTPMVSPDSRWLSYVSDETGHPEVWVVPFPNPNGARWQVSSGGGSEPAWAPDGKSIYYVAPNRELMNVEVMTTSGFAVGARHVLFSVAPYRRNPSHRAYEVFPDNQHFLMIRQGAQGSGNLVVVENWMSELRKEVNTHR